MIRSIVLRAKSLTFLSPAQRAGERWAPRAACGLKGRDGLYDMATRNYRDPSGCKRFFLAAKPQADWPGLRNVGPSARASMREPGPPTMITFPYFDDRATLGQGTRRTGRGLTQHDEYSMVTAKIQNGIFLTKPGINRPGLATLFRPNRFLDDRKTFRQWNQSKGIEFSQH